MRVLELVSLDILPQGLDDHRSGLGVDTKHTGQARVQLELRRLDGNKGAKAMRSRCLLIAFVDGLWPVHLPGSRA